MFNFLRRLRKVHSPFRSSHRRSAVSVSLEVLEDRFAPAITAIGATISATEGAIFSGTVGTLAGAAPTAVAADFTATINWGDGTASSPGDGSAVQIVADASVPGQFDVVGTHTYAEEGTINVSVLATDTVGGGSATTAFYSQTNLVTDDPSALASAGFAPAAHTDANLVNPWGLAFAPTGPFWVSDNGAGVSTLYDGSGNPQALVVTIPASLNAGATSPAPVTGIVFNASATDFNVAGAGTPAHFIFATEDGTIAAWNSGTAAVLKVDNADFVAGPVYKGLAIGNNGAGNFIYATNFRGETIDVFDSTFTKVTLGTGGFGTFADPNAVTDLVGFAPFGIENIGNLLYVTYAKQAVGGKDDVAGPGNGFVDVFDLSGHFVNRLVSHGNLNSPWGLALAPSTFGTFANDLLVGNFGDGHINAYNPNTGALLGQLNDASNQPIDIEGLWGLKFGNNGTAGSRGALYFTAGINDEANGLFGSLSAQQASTATVADAPLVAGDVASTAASAFSGIGGNSTSVTAGTANVALQAFQAAIGGVNNGANPPAQSTGFRAINWDGVALDGTDFGGSSTVVDPNHVVGIPVNRFQERGVQFEVVYAVSGAASASDASTFSTVNPNVANLFPAFSPTKTFAMFNDNGIDLSFVVASPHATTSVPAATRGFGAIFRNVELANTTSIEYFNGDVSLGKFFVPVGAKGQAEFLGELFSAPIVTRVSITLGTDVLFSFDGTHFSAGTQADDPANGHNLVVTDDFVYAEPVSLSSLLATATIGRSFSGQVATFSDLDPNGVASDYIASIDWGDGHHSAGTIAADGHGGFAVSGANTFAASGNLPIRVNIQDLGGSTLVINNSITVIDANHRFVQTLYNDYLGRTGDAGELNFWVNVLASGGRTAAVAGIAGSFEARDHLVQSWYSTYLGRQAAAGEENSWVSQLASQTEEQVLSTFLSEPVTHEFYTRAQTLIPSGTADERYVQALFKLLLNRTGSSADVSSWVNQIPSIGRGGVARGFLTSTEYRTDVVAQLYATFLDRSAPPSAAEIASWVNSGLDLRAIQAAMAATDEYFNNG